MLLEFGLIIMVLALICEYVDSTLGMGYGTTLTPVLMMMGLDPLQIVPAVLFSELITGTLAAAAHHKIGNVNFRDPEIRNVTLALALCSIVGAVVAVFIAVSIPPFYLKLYIGLLVAIMGITILWKRNSQSAFSWLKITLLGIVAAFNKGMSGGGYGPLVTSGQILSGVDGKKAVGITSLSEGITCLVGLTTFVILGESLINWELAGFLVVGAVLSVPLSAISVKKLQLKKMTTMIGVATLILGLFTLWKLFA